MTMAPFLFLPSATPCLAHAEHALHYAFISWFGVTDYEFTLGPNSILTYIAYNCKQSALRGKG